jgi:hypothetical protein
MSPNEISLNAEQEKELAAMYEGAAISSGKKLTNETKTNIRDAYIAKLEEEREAAELKAEADRKQKELAEKRRLDLMMPTTKQNVAPKI